MAESEQGNHSVKQPVFRVPPIVVVVIVGLIAIHVLLFVGGPQWQVLSLYLFSFIPARIGVDIPYPAVPGTAAWSFVSYALLHGDWLHLASNCIWFTVFGTIVARRLSAGRFLTLCVAAAASGAAAMLARHWGEEIILVGASGSVSGLIAAAIPLMYAKGASFGDLQSADLRGIKALTPKEFASDRRALFFSLVWFAVTLLTGAGSGWLSNAFSGANAIAWEAHLGGFAGGLAGFYLLDRQPDALRPKS
jgi:membrane associated rhomboid family serine protease